jgi:hypothetical protein
MAGDDAHDSGPPAGTASPGPGVDRYGAPVVDPTKNVLDLVRAAIERQDNLREAESRHIRELASIRAEHDQQLRVADQERDRELRASDHDRMAMRAAYEDKLRVQESARIDAIRAVDVGAVTRAAEVSATQAATLATQQQASADALRGQVEQARIATADALAQALAPITKSIEDLRAAQYQQQGEKSSKVETSSISRDDLAIESARIQAAQARLQLYGVIIAAVVLALGLYAALHKLGAYRVQLPGGALPGGPAHRAPVRGSAPGTRTGSRRPGTASGSAPSSARTSSMLTVSIPLRRYICITATARSSAFCALASASCAARRRNALRAPAR